jgi:hypothetical protein
MLHTFHTVTDTVLFAFEVEINPEAPPGAGGLLKLLNWLLWGVFLVCVAGVVFSGGKFAWEKWSSGSSDAMKQLVGSLVGVVISGSATQILNAVSS